MGRNALERYFLGAEVEELTARHQEVIAVRDQVYRLHGENLAIAGLSGISQIETLAKVAKSLPPGAGPVFSWEFKDGELKIMLRDESPDLRQYVSRLEAVSGFSDIAVQPLDRQKACGNYTSGREGQQCWLNQSDNVADRNPVSQE